MNPADLVRRAGRDNGGRPQPGIRMIVRKLPVPPELVQAGKGERAAIRPAEVVRLLPALRTVTWPVPLVVAVGGQQAPAARGRRPEGWLDADRLGPRVDHPAADGRMLGPGRDQPPADDTQF